MIEPIINGEFYALIDPNGVIQTMTIADTEATSMAIVKMMHKAGWGTSWHELKMKGYTYQKVRVTIVHELGTWSQRASEQ